MNDTANFREWFGSSKVVDEHGLPIKVYHGTNQQFREFDTTPIHELDRRRMGAYFTANPNFAATYGPHQIDAYLCINNPLDIRGLSAEQAIALLPVTAFDKAAMRSAFRGQDYSQYGLLESTNQIALRKALEQAGYDGVAYSEGYAAAFIVFQPEQIHRVTGHDNDYQPPPPEERAKATLVSDNRETGMTLGTNKTGGKMNDSANFREWFGDSKVVDEHGQPLVVYHGTARDFAEFSPSKRGSNSGYHASDVGFFATASPELASMYADMAARANGGQGQALVPLYITIRSPMIYESASQYYRDIDLLKKNGISGEEWRLKLEEKGFDGIIVRDDKEEVVAFRPEQIKSAIGNNGSFDINSPSLTDHGGSIRPAPEKAKQKRASMDLGMGG